VIIHRAKRKRRSPSKPPNKACPSRTARTGSQPAIEQNPMGREEIWVKDGETITKGESFKDQKADEKKRRSVKCRLYRKQKNTRPPNIWLWKKKPENEKRVLERGIVAMSGAAIEHQQIVAKLTTDLTNG
jgi:hypothetical protein